MLDTIFPRNIRKLSALLAFATSAVLTTSLQAFSQGISFGELKSELVVVGFADDKFEMLGNSILKSQSTIGEYRIGNHLLRAWEAADSSQNVWVAEDGNKAFQIDKGTTKTFFSPTVAAVGSDFYVLHVGDNGQIWFARVGSTDNTASAIWLKVPGAITDGPISAVELGPGSSRMLLVYHDSDRSDLRYTVFSSGAWSTIKSIAGGTGLTSPSVAWNASRGVVDAVLQGEDSRVWKSMYHPNNDIWEFWTPEGDMTFGRPTIAVNNAGTMLIARPLGDDTYTWASFDSSFNRTSDWTSTDSPKPATEARLVSDGQSFFLTYNDQDKGCLFGKFIFN
jgi:hypothetical protein